MDNNPNTEKIEIRISDVIMMLEEGKTREQIGEHYGLNKAETTLLFKHEKLKGRRPKKTPSFTIVDDLGGNSTPSDEQHEEVEAQTEQAQDEVLEEYTQY